ncbi:MAG: TonB-dependent receptor [Lysobacterales bacterium]|jgi:catecholate siderophore receptor
MPSPSHSAPLYAALLAAFALPAQAESVLIETADGASAPAEQLDRVDVHGSTPDRYRAEAGGLKLPEPLRDAPRAVSVVPNAVIETQGAINLADALRNVAGLTLASGEGGFRGDNISLRGFGGRTDIYLDGVRDNGQYARDTFATEQVEVLKGAAAMQFGRGAAGGVVNTASKRPQAEDFQRVDLSLGADSLQRAVLDLNESVNEAAGLRVAALYHDADSFRDEVFVERRGVAPSLGLSLGDTTRLEANLLWQTEDGVADYGIPWHLPSGTPVDVPRGHHYGLGRDSFSQYDVLSSRVALSHGFANGAELRHTLSFSDVERLHRMVRPNALTAATLDASTPVTRNHTLTGTTQNNLYNQTDLAFSANTGAISHEIALGLELGREDFSNRARAGLAALPPVPLLNPGSVRVSVPLPSSLEGAALSTYSKTATDTRALYLQDNLKLSEQWRLLAGLRHDQFEARVSNELTGAVLEREDDMTAYTLGAVYQPSEKAAWYANASNAFNPSAETFGLSESSAQLDPEETRNLEVGFKYTPLGDRLLVDVALFSLDKFNARDVDPGNTAVQTLDGRQRSRGVELGISGAITEAWHVFGGVALMDPEIIESNQTNSGVAIEGNRPANAPRRSASLWSVYEFGGGFELGGGAFHVGERFANTGNTLAVPAYTRWDAYAGYRTKRWRVALNAYNLADTEYFEFAHPVFLTPGEGRSWRLSFSYAF